MAAPLALDPAALRPFVLALVLGAHGAAVWASLPAGQAIGVPEPVSVLLEREEAEPAQPEPPLVLPEPPVPEPLVIETPPFTLPPVELPPLLAPVLAEPPSSPPIEAPEVRPEENAPVIVPPVPVIPPPPIPRPLRVEPPKREPPRPLARPQPKQQAALAPRPANSAPAARPPGAGGADPGYASRVRAMLQARAHALGFEDVNATVGLSFTIDASGRVTTAAIAKPSGDFKVDAALRRMLASASFPPPPGGRFTGAVTVRIR